MSSKGFDYDDAIDRARTEILLELRRWSRRLKERAVELTESRLEPGIDPVEVGRAAALEALNEDFYADEDSSPPALGT